MLLDGDSTEGWSDWWFEYFGRGGVSLCGFVMAVELLLIKFLAVAVIVFDFVILIDGVKQDNLALVVSKMFLYDGSSRKDRREGWSVGGVLHSGCW